MKPTHQLKLATKLFEFVFFLFIFIIYIHNATRDIYAGDIGDLVTAAYVFGVAHPPGYPLFTFLGFLFSNLPFPIPPVTKVAYVSTFFSFLGLMIYYFLCKFITKQVFISLLCTSILAFSHLFWMHAEIPEVFGLNNFLAILLTSSAIIYYYTKKTKWLYLTCFTIGLTITHHHTIVFLFPAIGILLLSNFTRIISSPKTITLCIGLFLLGLTPYLYVPIAASQNPIVNWNNASNFSNFLHLFLRKDYGFAPHIVNEIPIGVKLIVVNDFMRTLIDSYSFQMILVAILGIWNLFTTRRLLFFSLLIGFILSGPFFAYYSAFFVPSVSAWGIAERFYVMPFVLFTFFFPFGFLQIITLFRKISLLQKYSTVLLSYFLIIPVLLFVYNFEKTDFTKTSMGNTFVKDMFSHLPKNAVLFVAGDTTTFNTWYLHFVEGYRKDIDIISSQKAGSNYFLEQILNEYAQKHPTVPLNELMAKTIDELRKTRPIFSTSKLDFVQKDSILIPRGLVFELIYVSDVPPQKEYEQQLQAQWKKLHPLKKRELTPINLNMSAGEIAHLYAYGLMHIGDFYYYYYKNPTKAIEYFSKSIDHYQENSGAYAGLAVSTYQETKNCDRSISLIKQAISYYPAWKTYYPQLYLLQKKCNRDPQEIEATNAKFNYMFKQTIDSFIKGREHLFQ